MPTFEFRVRLTCALPIAPAMELSEAATRVQAAINKALDGLWPMLAVRDSEVTLLPDSAAEPNDNERCAYRFPQLNGRPCGWVRSAHDRFSKEWQHAFVTPHKENQP